jgi:hypothetical protein
MAFDPFAPPSFISFTPLLLPHAHLFLVYYILRVECVILPHLTARSKPGAYKRVAFAVTQEARAQPRHQHRHIYCCSLYSNTTTPARSAMANQRPSQFGGSSRSGSAAQRLTQARPQATGSTASPLATRGLGLGKGAGGLGKGKGVGKGGLKRLM